MWVPLIYSWGFRALELNSACTLVLSRKLWKTGTPRLHPRQIKWESFNEWPRKFICVFHSFPVMPLCSQGGELLWGLSLRKLQNFSENKYESNWQLLVCSLTALAVSRGRTGNQFLWHLLRETECILEKHWSRSLDVVFSIWMTWNLSSTLMVTAKHCKSGLNNVLEYYVLIVNLNILALSYLMLL